MLRWSRNEESAHFQPAACLGQHLKISVSDTKDRRYSSYRNWLSPPQIILQIEVMKADTITWRDVPDSCRLHQGIHWWKERMARGKKGWQGEGHFWHVGLVTGGRRQTVKNYQHSPMCCVLCSLTHPTLAHLSVSLASSIQLSMTIRSRLTPTTCSYQCSWGLGTADIFLQILWNRTRKFFFFPRATNFFFAQAQLKDYS